MSDSPVAIPSEFAELAAEYEIFGEIGRGGTAVVYGGRDRGLGRDVAIKVVHPRSMSPDDDAVARLAREARTVAQLQHPNIVTVYAVRRLSGGGLALIMQLAPGRTLKSVVLQDGPVTPDRCQRILRDVASALAYAHSRGVIHRDVKPENIFLDEESGQVLLADFGIARSLEQDSGTLTGHAIGTPFYMSPEQIDGTAIDGRSDLYSLGLVAWELLTGRRPWDGESLYNVIFKQKHEELPPIEALRPGVPLRLQYIIDRMLQKSPTARWAGADGLLSQLSHSVLPGDYGRWQIALRKRVERHQAAERERERAVQDAPEPGGLLASTIRFVRSGLAAKGGTADAQLANTIVVPLEPGQAPALGDPRSIGVTPPASADAVVMASPSWERRRFGGRRTLAIGASFAVAAAAIVGVALAARDGGLGSASGFSLAGRPPQRSDVASGSGNAPIATPVSRSVDPSTGAAVPPSAPTALAVGSRHSCVVATAGAIVCWGANERGQLGDGTAQRQVTPARVAADLAFISVSAGSAHSCAVTRLGDVYCWGSDTRGQLGDATRVRRNAPVRVAGPGIYRSVSTGDAHTCAVTIEGVIHCWGANEHGQLGDGTTTSRTVPTTIDGPVAERFAEVSAGGTHTCARTERGVVYCWGANDRGQLGAPGPDRPRPAAVEKLDPVASIAAGGAHSCAVTLAGAVRCWGANARGQLGTGGRSNAREPQPVRLATAAALVTAGGQHTCALLASGEAFCWGANGAGQLGVGSAADALVPVRVAAGDRLVAIAAGGAHTCAVTAAGAPTCWGDNAEGQLGDATRTGRRQPTTVASDSSARASAAGR